MKTIGEFYKEKVLSIADKRMVNLPSGNGDIRIVNEVFGWVLYNGKSSLECSTEEEARYLKVFLECGLNEVYVPNEHDYLNEILPELESIKRRIDEIIDERLETILNPKIRHLIRRDVYKEIAK